MKEYLTKLINESSNDNNLFSNENFIYKIFEVKILKFY